MSTDQYRTQVANIQKSIAKLQGEKAQKVDAAAKAGKKNHDALAAAARTSSASTATSKLREATRYASEQAKAETEVGKIEKKVADEHKKLVAAQKRLEDELKRERKRQDTAHARRITEEKKLMAEQKRTAVQQERVLRDLSQGLSRHENLHVQTALEIERLKALPEKITVVFFAADPGCDSTTKLGLDEEARLIGERIRASEHRDVLVFHTRWAVRPRDVLQAINELQPTVVHFSGHGTRADTLVLQDDQGNEKHVTKEAIVSAMALGAESVKLVFFNTCFSFNQAQGCLHHVPATIGMNRDVGDLPARVFSAQFYSAIGFGLSITKAFEQAKALVAMETPGEESIPELYVQEGLTEEMLTLVRPPSL
ncbi:CHAT domain protein [compost metagenome]